MRAVGFNFTKINIEKFSDKRENLKVSSNIDISEINEVKGEIFKTKEEFLGVKFNYTFDYKPEFGKLEFSGNLLVALEPKKSKEVLKQWKDEKMPEDFRTFIYNLILKKVNLKALELEDELNFPLHIPMPSVKKQGKQDK